MPKAIIGGTGAVLLGKDPMQAIAAEVLFGSASNVAGSGAGSPGTVTLTAPTGAGSGSSASSGSGSPGTVSLSAPTGAGHANGTGSGSPGTVTMSAPTGVASSGASIVFLDVLAGQSNAEGRATSVNGVDRTTIDVDVTGAYQYPGQSGQPGYQTLTTDITPLIHQSGYTITNNTLGPGEYLMRQQLADNPGSKAVAVPTAVGSTALASGVSPRWAPSLTPGAGGDLFENMIAQTVTDYGKAQTDFPGTVIVPVITFVQGEQDAGNGCSYATYYAALVNFVNYTRTRLGDAGIPNASTIKIVLGSMIPRLWDLTSPFYSAAYAAINRAHVMASLNLTNVLYSRGSADNNGSDTGAGGDGLHYLPAPVTRTQGTRLGLTLSDTVGPTMTGPSTFTSQYGQKLSFALSCNDTHATYEIVAGLDGALCELSDPYLTPAVRWVGDGTGPNVGTYSVNIRARDGSGNYGPTKTYTFAVALDVSPATFFSNGERGMVWDLSDLSLANMSQSIGGTGTVAVGSPVGFVRDLSPNGDDWFAAADNSSRPTLQIDSNGKYYLQPDGSNDVLLAATPFVTPGSNLAFTVIIGLNGAAQSATKTIIGLNSTASTTPFLIPMQASGTTTNIIQVGRNDSFGGGASWPSLTGVLDGTTRIITSAFTGTTSSRMRNAASRPSDGLAGSYTASGTLSMGPAVSITRVGLGANPGATPANFFAGRIYSGFAINRYLNDNEVKSGEDWVATRSLSAALPGQTVSGDGSGAGSPGTVTLTAPTGVGTGGSAANGSGSGSPGTITDTAPTGQGHGNGAGVGSAGTVQLSSPTGTGSGGVSASGAGGTNVIAMFPPAGAAEAEIDVRTPAWRTTHAAPANRTTYAPKRAA
jgi:hypothetical protein